MRFSIHVDAGYLYAALATRETGSSYRNGIQVDEKALIAELVAMAAADCKADPLRLLWYDAAKDGRPAPDQRRIGLLDGVRLRLGRINAVLPEAISIVLFQGSARPDCPVGSAAHDQAIVPLGSITFARASICALDAGG